MVVEITQDNFEQIDIKSEKSVLLDFYAAWCGPCKLLHPILDKLAEECKILFGKVNVDIKEELTAIYTMMHIPIVIILFKGKISGTKILGARLKEESIVLF